MHEAWKRNSGPTPISEAETVKSVIEKFREKYGVSDVKKYYSKLDVAVVIQLT